MKVARVRDRSQAVLSSASGMGGATPMPALDDLTDVDTTSTPPTDGQALVFDDGTDTWVPGTVATSGGSGQMGPPGMAGEDGPSGPPGPAGLAGTSATGTDFAVNVVMDGGGVGLVTGIQAWYEVPIAGTILAVRLVANAVGSMVIDIWREVYVSLPATVLDTITAAAKPTLASAQTYQDTTLTGWSTSLAAGNWLYINIDSVSGISKATLSLTMRRA